ncbi:MAG: iron ABC transporter ATP-binding protein [Firmicutes bacterium HGW-Firmicutes-15]|nr:MAG: iron ABC transporter ATP-binding protein [Firmicutes bacterium HGW-Firmicutes-15]
MIYDVKNLCFKYTAGGRTILKDASVTLQEGEIMSILGPNGAGKSTLLNCMANLLKPDSGEIYLCGRKMREMGIKEVAGCVSYVQQTHTPTFAYTVLNFVIMGRAPKIGMFRKPKTPDVQAARDALEILGIAHLAEKPYTEISGGERQQVIIARAIVQEPKVILFDEPTAHLDYGNQFRILGMIKIMQDRGYSIIITTHNPDHALLLGGTAAIIDRNGQLDVGKSSEIITEERLKKLYNTELRLLPIPELSRMACLQPLLKNPIQDSF